MILGIGTDLASVTRIENLLTKFGEKFVAKIFTPDEIAQGKKIIPENQAIFYAKRFAAKEAFAKACGLGIGRGIDFHDIAVFNDNLGKPYIKILNEKEQFLCRHFAVASFKIHLSLTDENPMAQAMVVIEK